MQITQAIIGIALLGVSMGIQAEQATPSAASPTKHTDLTPKTDGFDAIFAQWAQQPSATPVKASSTPRK